MCGVLGPLSRKVTLGGHPLILFLIGSVCIFSPPHPTSRVVSPLIPPTPAPNSLPHPAGKSLQQFGPQAYVEIGTPVCWGCSTSPWQFGAGAGGYPRPGHHGSPARAGQYSPRLQAVLCPPCACRLSADCGSVLWGSGNFCNIQNTENRLIT